MHRRRKDSMAAIIRAHRTQVLKAMALSRMGKARRMLIQATSVNSTIRAVMEVSNMVAHLLASILLIHQISSTHLHQTSNTPLRRIRANNIRLQLIKVALANKAAKVKVSIRIKATDNRRPVTAAKIKVLMAEAHRSPGGNVK